MTEYIKTDLPGFVKDRRTNLIINNNEDQYRSVVALREKSKKLANMEKRVIKLEEEIEDLKKRLTNVENPNTT